MPLPDFNTEALFDPDLYLYFSQSALSPERTQVEVDFLANEVIGPEPRQVLDLACGHGRHAVALAGLGHHVTGIDSSAAFLELGRAAARQAGVMVDFQQGDMRQLDQTARFEVVACLFTAFGYFSDEDNLQVLDRIARSLVRQGCLFLDVINRDSLARRFLPTAVQEREGNLMIDRMTFDAVHGRIVNRRTYLMADRRVEAPFFTRVYTLQELTLLLTQVGLRVERVFGDWSGGPLTLESGRLMLIARK